MMFQLKLVILDQWTQYIAEWHGYDTSHSAYAATETESVVAKIDGLLPPNFL